MRTSLFLFLTLAIAFGCAPGSGSESDSEATTPEIKTVLADHETSSPTIASGDDAADDAVVWVNSSDPAASLIMGTNKKGGESGGLGVYALDGAEKYYWTCGHANNVDVRYDFTLGNGETTDIVALTERLNNNILVFTVDTAGMLDSIPGGRIASQLQEVYGFCLYHNPRTDKYYAFANDKTGAIEQYEIFADEATGGIGSNLVRTLKVATQPEGMVADDALSTLYVGEEGAGIWKFQADPSGSSEASFVAMSNTDNPNIAFNIEGLTIYQTSATNGYLIASAQGNSTYAMFQREGDNAYIGSFKIDSDQIDGTQDTEGVTAVSANLGPKFPKGVFVAQDGLNTDGTSRGPQNFKIVDFQKIISQLELQ